MLAPTLEFLRRHAPFDRMAGAHLEFLAKHLRLGFYLKDELVTGPGHAPAARLYLIKQGRVRAELPQGSREVWELEAGECFPIGAMLARRSTAMRYRAAEDTFCFELDRERFDKLLALSPVFHDFCTRRLADLLGHALCAMQGELASEATELSFSAPLAQLVRRAPVTCAPDAPLRDAVARMHAERVGSIVAVDDESRPRGIFTLHDLLGRVAARDLALDAPVRAVMTPDPLALAPGASAHEAMVTMARHGVGHLCLVENGRLAGVVSERDLFSLQRVRVVHLTRSITHAPDVATLARLGRDIHRLVGHVLLQGASVVQLMQLIATLNDHVARRVIALSRAEAPDAAVVPFTWLSFGSEGRQEQTLRTDQDNGMLFVPPAGMDAERARALLLPLARRINEALAACGFPLCDGNVMASNPECCLTFAEWRARLHGWIEHGAPAHLLKASIYFDMRALDGDAEPVERLRHEVLGRARATPRFLRQLAGNALRLEPPLGLLGDFELDGRGEYARLLNLKLRGSTPFVDGARLLAVAHGIAETNTFARIRAAVAREAVRASEAEAWCDAYAFVQLLRMRQHQAQERAGEALSNHIDPARLNELDRRILKEAFRQARKLQSYLRLEYQL